MVLAHDSDLGPDPALGSLVTLPPNACPLLSSASLAWTTTFPTVPLWLQRDPQFIHSANTGRRWRLHHGLSLGRAARCRKTMTVAHGKWQVSWIHRVKTKHLCAPPPSPQPENGPPHPRNIPSREPHSHWSSHPTRDSLAPPPPQVPLLTSPPTPGFSRLSATSASQSQVP